MVKLFPIISFEVQLITHGITSWLAVNILARLIIAFEIFLGLSLLQNFYIKKIFIPLAIALLSFFTLDLVRAIIYLGFGGDCGCFGQVIIMTPLEAIIKNIILIALLVYLYRLIEVDESKKWALLIPSLVVPFAAVFLLYPMQHYTIIRGNDKNNSPKPQAPVIVNQQHAGKASADIPVKKRDTTVLHAIKENEKLPVAVFKDFSGGVTVDFTKGKEIVCVLNVECEECIETAKAIGNLNKEMTLPPVYFLLLGDEKQLPEFISKTKTSYPYKLMNEEEFFTLIKGSPPRIWLLQNGKVIGDWNFRNFTIDNFKTAVKKLQK